MTVTSYFYLVSVKLALKVLSVESISINEGRSRRVRVAAVTVHVPGLDDEKRLDRPDRKSRVRRDRHGRRRASAVPVSRDVTTGNKQVVALQSDPDAQHDERPDRDDRLCNDRMVSQNNVYRNKIKVAGLLPAVSVISSFSNATVIEILSGPLFQLLPWRK